MSNLPVQICTALHSSFTSHMNGKYCGTSLSELSLVSRPKWEEKGPGFHCSRMHLIPVDSTTTADNQSIYIYTCDAKTNAKHYQVHTVITVSENGVHYDKS